MSNMPKVVVGMSGGVDSSVAAALLVKQGYSVTGIMLRLWSEPGREGTNRCCTPDSMAQARKVASSLGIPFYVIDAKDLFHHEVVEYFEAGYAAGLTPNPCLICNQNIRWGFMLGRARMMGADYMATGHYARLRQNENGHVQLMEAVDHRKDQSYVLSVLNQDQLAHTMLPLGDLNKTEVRLLAHDFGLAVAERPESQDLCFLGGVDYRLFLQAHSPGVAQPGLVVDQQGTALGKHEGLAFYTIGQRKGLGISSQHPLYVIEKDLKENKLVVGWVDQMGKRKLIARHTNWIVAKPVEDQFQAQVKIRYKAEKAGCTVLDITDDSFQVVFDQPQRGITPGQSAVIYRGEECLGCGIIEKSSTT